MRASFCTACALAVFALQLSQAEGACVLSVGMGAVKNSARRYSIQTRFCQCTVPNIRAHCTRHPDTSFATYASAATESSIIRILATWACWLNSLCRVGWQDLFNQRDTRSVAISRAIVRTNLLARKHFTTIQVQDSGVGLQETSAGSPTSAVTQAGFHSFDDGPICAAAYAPWTLIDLRQ